MTAYAAIAAATAIAASIGRETPTTKSPCSKTRGRYLNRNRKAVSNTQLDSSPRTLKSSRRMRIVLGQGPLCVFVTLPYFVYWRAGTFVLVLDIGADWPAFLLQQLQHGLDWRVALAPRRVVALVLFSILQMQVRDVGVVLADVRDRIEVGRGEMPDVEVHLVVLRHLHGRREAFRRGKLVGVGQVRVAVHRHPHAVLFGKRDHALRHRQRRRRG